MSGFWKILNKTDGGDVLDVACGNGQFIEILKENLQSFSHITGIDFDKKAIEEVKSRFDDSRFTFVHGNSDDMPFPGEHFNLVSISKGLHHLKEIRQSLKEMHRVLKWNGLMIISEMYSDDLTESQKSHMYYHHLKADVDRFLGIPHHHTFRKHEIVGLVHELNLRDMTIHNLDQNPEIKENPEDYIAKMEVWKEHFRDSDLEREMHLKIEALKHRFREKGLSSPPHLVIMGYKQEPLTK